MADASNARLGIQYLGEYRLRGDIPALKHLNKTYALLGTVISITIHLLFIAYYPVLLGMSYLSDRFVTAEASQREVYATAAEALIAMNGAFNPPYESVFAVGILLISVAMLGGVFSKWIAYLGIVTTASAFVALSLWPIVGVGYFWWWVFSAGWFIAIGWQLFQLGGPSAETTSSAAISASRR